MRHRKLHYKLGRNSSHRMAMLRNITTSLFDHEQIVTTAAKAKAVRGFAESLITLAKKGNLNARRLVLRDIHDKAIVGKLFGELAGRFATREGGYTRIKKIGFRVGDAAPMAILELLEAKPKKSKIKDKKKEEKSEGVIKTLKGKFGKK